VLPDGVAGELLLRSREPFAFATGYFAMPDKTVEAWRNLWFHTGDRVVRDADGHYRFVDRMKDSIRRRGENVSSWEVEQVLFEASGDRRLCRLSVAGPNSARMKSPPPFSSKRAMRSMPST